MKFRVAVSLESETQPVKTHRVDMDTQGIRKAISLGFRGALKAFPHSQFRSVVICVEKL